MVSLKKKVSHYLLPMECYYKIHLRPKKKETNCGRWVGQS